MCIILDTIRKGGKWRAQERGNKRWDVTERKGREWLRYEKEESKEKNERQKCGRDFWG